MSEAKTFTFRELTADDTFLICAVLSKIGISKFADSFGKDKIEAIVKGGQDNATAIGASIIFEAVDIILGNLSKCRDDIYRLLSSVTDMSYDEVRGLGFVDFTRLIVEFVKKEEFKDFFKLVSGFAK